MLDHGPPTDGLVCGDLRNPCTKWALLIAVGVYFVLSVALAAGIAAVVMTSGCDPDRMAQLGQVLGAAALVVILAWIPLWMLLWLHTRAWSP